MRSNLYRSVNASWSKCRQGASFFQPKFSGNEPNNIYESEAKEVANNVTYASYADTFFKPSHSILSKQKNSFADKAEFPPETAITSKGYALDAGTKGFMESRFGQDFSNVQIHNDRQAHESSQMINAQAYTYGNHIAFGKGMYQPQTSEGKKLLAHELTHVVQQNAAGKAAVNRQVNDNSTCSNKIDTAAPPYPMNFIILADMMAESRLSGAILKLKLDLMTSTSTNLSGDSVDTYRKYFGDPVASGGKFKNRFSGSAHATFILAQISEMQSLISQLENAQKTLSAGITYHCMGNGIWKSGDINFSKCKPDSLMKAGGGVNAIGICPAFWSAIDDSGTSIVHELFHITFGYGDHDKKPFAQSFVQRRGEPQCYANFIAAVENVSSTDESCPPV